VNFPSNFRLELNLSAHTLYQLMSPVLLALMKAAEADT
jgi:hypothetical protein